MERSTHWGNWLGRALVFATAIAMLGTTPSQAQNFITIDELETQAQNAGVADVLGPFDENIAGFLDLTERFSFARLLGIAGAEGFPPFAEFSDEARATIDGVPVPSGSTSIAYTYDPALETFIRWERPLAPALSQNARTNGKNVLTLGFSASHLDYENFNDADTGRVTFAATELEVFFPSTGETATASDVLLAELDLELQVYSFTMQFGVLDRLDLGIFVPVIDTKFRGKVIDRFFFENPPSGASGPPGRFSPANARRSNEGQLVLEPVPGAPSFESIDDIDRSGFADAGFSGIRFDDDVLGIGDVVLRSKVFFGSVGKLDTGFLLNLSLPTGDEDDLQGVGSVRFDPRFLVSTATPRFAVHMNAGYHADVEEHDRDRFDYAVGGEVRVAKWMTLLLDHVARLEIAGDDQTRKFEIVPGVKVNPYRDVIVGFNAIVPLNDEGLTTDWTPNGLIDASIVF